MEKDIDEFKGKVQFLRYISESLEENRMFNLGWTKEKIDELEEELIKIYENLLRDFEMAKQNADGFRMGADVLSARLNKAYTFLESKGYSIAEINEIMKLDSERSYDGK